jgi:hypothetical protein
MAQALQVCKITSMHLGAGGDKRFGVRIGASKAEHLMAGCEQFLHDCRADEACGSGYKYTHVDLPVMKILLSVKLTLYNVVGDIIVVNDNMLKTFG